MEVEVELDDVDIDIDAPVDTERDELCICGVVAIVFELTKLEVDIGG
jgi:hypothetical protein